MNHCDECPYKMLYGKPTKTIGPRGPRNARVAIVGEAPGEQELKKGVPFIGPSGKLLKKTCDEIGLDLSEVFITNSLSCKPIKGEGQKIPRSAVNSCNVRLMSELKEYPRDLVIGLGGTALRSLSGKENPTITVARGQVFDHGAGFPVLPTIHPSYVLHTGGAMLPLLRKDLEYAVEIINGRRKDPGHTKYIFIDDDEEDDIRMYVERLISKPRLVSVDIETASLDRINAPVLYIGFSHEKNTAVIFLWRTVLKYRQLFQKMFSHPNIQYVFHNGQFDTAFMVREGFKIDVHHDTMLSHYLRDETKNIHSLKAMAAVELGSNEWVNAVQLWLGMKSTDGNADASFQVVPHEEMCKYLARDVDSTRQLHFLEQNQLSKDKKLKRVYERIMIPAANMLREVEMYGLWVDPDETNKLQQELMDRIEEIRKKLVNYVNKITGGRIDNYNPASTPQTSRVLYRILKLKPLPNEKRFFKKTTSKEDLERLPSHKFVDMLLLFRKLKKYLSTYIKSIAEKSLSDGRLHTIFKLTGTLTGRLSSEEPNIQNIPKYDPEDDDAVNIKAMFGAPYGKVLIELDYSQAELRLLGALADEEVLRDIYANDRDLHSEVAAKMFGPNFTDIQRRFAKTINFGIVYGLGAAGLARRFKMPIPEAQKYIDAWFQSMPKAKAYLDKCARYPLHNKPIRSPTGRLRRWGLVDESNIVTLQNQAKNAPIQVGASDFTLRSACHILPKIKKLGAHIVNLVHDSIVIEAPDDPSIIRRVIKIARRIMERVPSLYVGDAVPFKVDASIGTNWGELKRYVAA